MNKNVPGLMKDEACGRNITKVISLSAKQYAYEIEGYDRMCGNEICNEKSDNEGCLGAGDRKCKGVKESVVKGSLMVNHYQKCLGEGTSYYARFSNLLSRKHDVTTECITKVALTSADNKRVIIPEYPEHRTLAPRHWRVKHPSFCTTDIDMKKTVKKGV